MYPDPQSLMPNGKTSLESVLFLTAQVSTENLVQGLVQLAADDYLPKPFAADELIARVQVLLRMKKAEDQSRD